MIIDHVIDLARMTSDSTGISTKHASLSDAVSTADVLLFSKEIPENRFALGLKGARVGSDCKDSPFSDRVFGPRQIIVYVVRILFHSSYCQRL